MLLPLLSLVVADATDTLGCATSSFEAWAAPGTERYREVGMASLRLLRESNSSSSLVAYALSRHCSSIAMSTLSKGLEKLRENEMPIHGTVALHIYRGCEDRVAAIEWASEVVPKIADFHASLRLRRLEGDVEFNAALAASETALADLCSAIERRRPRFYGEKRRRKIFKAKENAPDALDEFWTGNRYQTPGNLATTVGDLTALNLPDISRERTEAVVAVLVDPRRVPTFACGKYPVSNAQCGFGHFVSLDQNLWIERGLRATSQVGLADWLRDATLDLVNRTEWWRRHPYRPYNNYDDETGLPLVIEETDENATTIAAAVVLLLLTPDAKPSEYPDPPVSSSLVFTVLSVELFVACLVASACFATNLRMIKNLRRSNHGRDTLYSHIGASR